MELIRADVSNRLVHLTRDYDGLTAEAALASIMAEEKIRGSSRGIRGSYSCICFSETPVSLIALSIASSGKDVFRYEPFGVMVSKDWFFSCGGRPVIYQPDTEFEGLPESIRYRHVRFEPPKHDFTWEREWRAPGTELKLDSAQTTVIVPTRRDVERIRDAFVARKQESLRALGMSNIFGAFPHINFPWNVIALEDLGISFDRRAR